MKLATCEFEGVVRTGLQDGDDVALLPPSAPSVVEIIEQRFDEAALRPFVERILKLDKVRMLPPISRPEKIICVGLNYTDHAAEAGLEIPAYPALFSRFSSSQVGAGDVVIAPGASAKFDYEAELAVIIGHAAWQVPASDAMAHIAGYACFADNSARDFQAHSRQVTAGKNFLSSGAFGPWLTTADEVPDYRRLEIIGRLNGQEVQHANLSQLIFSVEELVAYISSFTRLIPGDVIVTGTPAGVGMSRNPPLWLKPGDVFEVEIPGVGLLRNTVSAGENAGR